VAGGFVECSVRSLVLAPTGRDARLIATLLKEVGVVGDICTDVSELAKEMRKGAAMAIVADEALRGSDLRPIARFMASQGAWSDLPVILLTHRGGVPGRDPELMRIAEVLGNVNFLERPFHMATLASMVRAARRNRHRQYEAQASHTEIVEREQQLQTAMTAGRLGSWSLEIEGANAAKPHLEISRTSREHFGRPSAALNYDRLAAAIHREERGRWRAEIERSLKEGSDFIGEYRNIWPDGTEHWLDMRARALKDAYGETVRLVGVSSDITARKVAELERERLMRELAAERSALSELTHTLEQRVARATAQLRAEVAAREKTQSQLLQSQKMESVGQLTGGIAHDFNNLLMAIMGSLEILRKRTPDDVGIRRLIDGAMQGATRGASLTQRMLAFARQQELRTSSADMGELILGMQELLHRSIGPRIALRIHVAEGLPPAEVDAHQVELAVLNLVINARDAMPAGGAIDIRVDSEEMATLNTMQLKPGNYLRVQIIDSGVGMDAETLRKAIEPFFSTKAAGKGTGLGLSMTHGLAMQLGGALTLASEVGQGTTATLWLPVAQNPARTHAGAAQAAGTATSVRAKILIVDDDPLVANSTVDMLVDLGHSVTEANSGERAVTLLESDQPLDLLLTDQAMPGMTGIELAEIARSKRPGLPILLVTGYADLPACELAKLPRLAKPYNLADLQGAIEALLSKPPSASKPQGSISVSR
jgi:PAS domain S-box-containing protein